MGSGEKHRLRGVMQLGVQRCLDLLLFALRGMGGRFAQVIWRTGGVACATCPCHVGQLAEQARSPHRRRGVA